VDRDPAVAGSFYPGRRATLERDVAALLALPAGAAPTAATGVVAPHAGYVYSGAVAGATYARVAVPARAVVLCPNHTGLGARVSLWPGGAWRTPLGDVPVDAELTAALSACPLVEEDRAAHRREHAAEVQLPFLQALRPDVRVAVLCLGPLSGVEAERLGEAIAGVLRTIPALLVASSDMSHYVAAAQARRLDRLAIERILALDAAGLHRVVHEEGISMCGVVPVTVMLAAARALGARAAELVRYATSGDVTGDDRSVVGYAGAIVR
jgi:AmmeMemoRadiSam system protein B